MVLTPSTKLIHLRKTVPRDRGIVHKKIRNFGSSDMIKITLRIASIDWLGLGYIVQDKDESHAMFPVVIVVFDKLKKVTKISAKNKCVVMELTK